MPRPDDCDDRDPSIGAARRGWIDADGDGYGSDVATERCPAEGELANASGDCDDAEAKISPAAVEVCNGRDDDCDGEIDDGIDVPTWYRDADGAQPDTALAQCDQPVGYADNVADCDDSDWAVNPATEWHPDADADGFGDAYTYEVVCAHPPGFLLDGSDCEDSRPDVHPGGVEVCDDADMDEDCNSLADDADPAEALRTAVIERLEPQPVEVLFPGGLSPPGAVRCRRWKDPASVYSLATALAFLFKGAVALRIAVPALLVEALRRLDGPILTAAR